MYFWPIKQPADTWFLHISPGIVGIPIWLRLSKVYGKHIVWIFAMATACFAFLFVPLLSSGDIGLFLIITIIKA